MSALAWLLVMLPAAVQVTVAPDQPMPFVYSDDPLIIELYSETDAEVEGRLFLQAAHTGGRIEIPLGTMFLHGGASYWRAVHDAPRERGFYTAEIVLAAGDAEHRAQARFCRIDRPTALQRLPVYAHCSGEGASCALIALRSVGIDTVRVAVDNPDLPDIAATASHIGTHLVIVMSLSQVERLPEETQTLLQSQCESILRFEIVRDSDEPDCDQSMEALRAMGCPAGVSLVVSGASEFERLMRAGCGDNTRHVTLTSSQWSDAREVLAIRRMAAHYGHEGWQTHVICSTWRPGGADSACRFIHRFIQYRAAGAAYVGLNASVVADDMGVQEMMAYLNGLALRLVGHTFVGPLAAQDKTHGLVFRAGAAWFAALWNEQATGAVSVPIDGAMNIQLTDALGNPIATPEPKEGALVLTVGQEPLYLTGYGGVILGRAAAQQIKTLVNDIAENALMREHLPQGVIDLVSAIGADPYGAGNRLRFLELLRLLPRIEEQWHGRQLPRHVAVPIIAKLSELARAVCLIEEDRGELFQEPLSVTLARTEEQQSLYLTGSAGTARSRERGDWILGEVRRLVDEAEALDAADRKIEACAVATLAEWRAQALKFAAQAEVPREPIPTIRATTVSRPETPDAEKEEDAPEDEEDAPEPETTPEPETDKDGYQEITHTVASGDNPYNIARKYNVSLDNLLEWNNMQRNVILRIGQKLVVRVKNAE